MGRREWDRGYSAMKYITLLILILSPRRYCCWHVVVWIFVCLGHRNNIMSVRNDKSVVELPANRHLWLIQE